MEYSVGFTNTFAKIFHYLRKYTALIALCTLCLRYSKLAEKVLLELQLTILRHRHDDHIPFTIAGNKDRLV